MFFAPLFGRESLAEVGARCWDAGLRQLKLKIAPVRPLCARVWALFQISPPPPPSLPTFSFVPAMYFCFSIPMHCFAYDFWICVPYKSERERK